MAAPTDLIDLRNGRSTECTMIRILELSSGGFRAWAADAPCAGDKISIQIPAIGPINARVTSAEAGEFHAEFCGSTDLRLLFIKKAPMGCNSWFEHRGD